MNSEAENTLAKSYNFECVEDNSRGHAWCMFHKNNKVWVWRCIRGNKLMWCRANKSQGVFCNHEYYEELEGALKNESNI